MLQRSLSLFSSVRGGVVSLSLGAHSCNNCNIDIIYVLECPGCGDAGTHADEMKAIKKPPEPAGERAPVCIKPCGVYARPLMAVDYYASGGMGGGSLTQYFLSGATSSVRWREQAVNC